MASIEVIFKLYFAALPRPKSDVQSRSTNLMWTCMKLIKLETDATTGKTDAFTVSSEIRKGKYGLNEAARELG